MSIPQEIKDALSTLEEVRAMEEAAKYMKASAQEVLVPYFATNDVKSIPLDGYNATYYKESSRATVNVKEMKSALLDCGVSSAVIHKAEQASTKVSITKASVRLVVAKGDRP